MIARFDSGFDAGVKSDRYGDWMCTFTGRKFWPLDPRAEDIEIQDIAHALSLQCRYGGHCRRFYSVAQHSVLVSRYLDDDGYSKTMALTGLLHDAAEAYLVDMPRPLKHSPEMAQYVALENVVQSTIYEKFGLEPTEPKQVKRADNDMLTLEMAYLMPELVGRLFYEHRGLNYDALNNRYAFITLPPDDAEEQFLRAFSQLRLR